LFCVDRCTNFAICAFGAPIFSRGPASPEPPASCRAACPVMSEELNFHSFWGGKSLGFSSGPILRRPPGGGRRGIPGRHRRPGSARQTGRAGLYCRVFLSHPVSGRSCRVSVCSVSFCKDFFCSLSLAACKRDASVCAELHAPSEQAQKNLGGCAPEPAPEKVRAFGAHKRGFAAHSKH
jgi:hypothetical protein